MICISAQVSSGFSFFFDDTYLLYVANAEVRNLCDWFTYSKLTLNAKNPTLYCFILTKKRFSYYPNIKIFEINSEKNGQVSLESKDYMRYLGVMIDKNLSWKFHIDAVANKISKIVGLIAK